MVSPPKKEPWKRKKSSLSLIGRVVRYERQNMWVVRPQLGSKIVGSAEAAVGLSPEEIRARRNVACVAHKPLVVCFVPMRIYRGVRLGYLGVAIVIFP